MQIPIDWDKITEAHLSVFRKVWPKVFANLMTFKTNQLEDVLGWQKPLTSIVNKK